MPGTRKIPGGERGSRNMKRGGGNGGSKRQTMSSKKA